MISMEDAYDACVELHQAGKTEEAIAALLKLTEEHPDYALPYLALATWSALLERFEDAVRYGKKYCELAPEDHFGYTALSALSIRGGLKEEAETALMQAQEARMAAFRKMAQERREGHGTSKS